MLGFAGKIAIVPDVDADQHHSSEDDDHGGTKSNTSFKSKNIT